MPQCSQEQLKSRPFPGAMIASDQKEDPPQETRSGCGGWRSGSPEQKRQAAGDKKTGDLGGFGRSREEKEDENLSACANE